jgi:hypothetical protein
MLLLTALSISRWICCEALALDEKMRTMTRQRSIASIMAAPYSPPGLISHGATQHRIPLRSSTAQAAWAAVLSLVEWLMNASNSIMCRWVTVSAFFANYIRCALPIAWPGPLSVRGGYDGLVSSTRSANLSGAPQSPTRSLSLSVLSKLQRSVSAVSNMLGRAADRDNRKLCRMHDLSLGELEAALGHEAARALRNISWHSSRRSRASSVPQ